MYTLIIHGTDDGALAPGAGSASQRTRGEVIVLYRNDDLTRASGSDARRTTMFTEFATWSWAGATVHDADRAVDAAFGEMGRWAEAVAVLVEEEVWAIRGRDERAVAILHRLLAFRLTSGPAKGILSARASRPSPL